MSMVRCILFHHTSPRSLNEQEHILVSMAVCALLLLLLLWALKRLGANSN